MYHFKYLHFYVVYKNYNLEKEKSLLINESFYKFVLPWRGLFMNFKKKKR